MTQAFDHNDQEPEVIKYCLYGPFVPSVDLVPFVLTPNRNIFPAPAPLFSR
jgi:hypothetical protein